MATSLSPNAGAVLLSAGAMQIVNIASASGIFHYNWKDRGTAPHGYIKGMALCYARVYSHFNTSDPAAIEMAKANTGDDNRDALSWYNDIFDAAGMDNSQDGVDTLRHLFVLLTGLGMRESSGTYCEGRDTTATNETAETAEAGLFQASYNARHASPLMQPIFSQYMASPNGFLSVFQEGVRCSPANLENFGAGDGADYQQLCKTCPAFAVEFAAVGLRNIRQHWGPIIRKQAEVRPECDDMFRQVQDSVDTFGLSPDIA